MAVEHDYETLEITKKQEELRALGGLRQAGDPMIDLDEEDPEQWDAFKDAHKFEILNQ